MSKLANQLTFKIHYPTKIIHKPMKFTVVDFTAEKMSSFSRLTQYNLSTTTQVKVYVEENKDDFDRITTKLKMAVIEEMFGEFRPLIYNMRAQLYEYDFESLDKSLEKLEHQMFVEGLE